MIWSIKLGSACYAFPAGWDWDYQNNAIRLKRGHSRTLKFRFGSICRLLYLFMQAGNMVYLIIFANYAEKRGSDMYFAFLSFVASLMAFSAQITFFFSFESFAAALNSFLILDNKMRKLILICYRLFRFPAFY